MADAAPSPQSIASISSGAPLPIAQLSPALAHDGSHYIESIVSLIWPYSSSTRTLSLLLADPDIRQRKSKGQVKVTFQGSSAHTVAESHVGIGDRVKLGLEGVQWLSATTDVATPGRKLEWDLWFKERAVLQVERDSKQLASIDVNYPLRLTDHTSSPLQEISPRHLNGDRTSGRPRDVGFWSSPAFGKDKFSSSGSFIEANLDPFADDDGFVVGKGRKRTKFARSSGSWRLLRTSSEREEHIPDSRPFEELRETTSTEQVESASQVGHNATAILEPSHEIVEKVDVDERLQDERSVAFETENNTLSPISRGDAQLHFNPIPEATILASNLRDPHNIGQKSWSTELEPTLMNPPETRPSNRGIQGHSVADYDLSDSPEGSSDVSNTLTPRLGPVTSLDLPLVSPLVQRHGIASSYFPTSSGNLSELDASGNQLDSHVGIQPPQFGVAISTSVTAEDENVTLPRDNTQVQRASAENEDDSQFALQESAATAGENTDFHLEPHATPRPQPEPPSTVPVFESNPFTPTGDPTEVQVSDFEFLNDSPIEHQSHEKKHYEALNPFNDGPLISTQAQDGPGFKDTLDSKLLNRESTSPYSHVEFQPQNDSLDQKSPSAAPALTNSALAEERALDMFEHNSAQSLDQYGQSNVFPIDPSLFTSAASAQHVQTNQSENIIPPEPSTSTQQDFNWSDKLLVSATECLSGGVSYTALPFPFKQNWHRKLRPESSRRNSQHSFLDGANDMVEPEEDSGEISGLVFSPESSSSRHSDIERQRDGQELSFDSSDVAIEEKDTIPVYEHVRNAQEAVAEAEMNVDEGRQENGHRSQEQDPLGYEEIEHSLIVEEIREAQVDDVPTVIHIEELIEERLTEKTKESSKGQIQESAAEVVKGDAAETMEISSTEVIEQLMEEVEAVMEEHLNPAQASIGEVIQENTVIEGFAEDVETTIEEFIEKRTARSTAGAREETSSGTLEERTKDAVEATSSEPVPDPASELADEPIEDHMEDIIEGNIVLNLEEYNRDYHGEPIQEHVPKRAEEEKIDQSLSCSPSPFSTSLPSLVVEDNKNMQYIIRETSLTQSPHEDQSSMIAPADINIDSLPRAREASIDQIFAIDPSLITTTSVPQLMTPDNTQQETEPDQPEVALDVVKEDNLPPTPQPTQLSITIPKPSTHTASETMAVAEHGTVLSKSPLEADQMLRRSPRLSKKFTLNENIGVASPYFTPRHQIQIQDNLHPSLPGSPTIDANADDRSRILSPTQVIVGPHDENNSITVTPLRSTKSAPNEPLRGFTTPLSYYVPLISLPQHFSEHVDILAVCCEDSKPPTRAKKGPRDWHTILQISDSSFSDSAMVAVQIFRAYKNAVPVVKRGEVVLLRAMKVQGRERQCILLSTDSSAWAIFSATEMTKELRGTPRMDVRIVGPPVEYGAKEKGYVRGLKKWWDAEGENRYPSIVSNKEKGKARADKAVPDSGEVMDDEDFEGITQAKDQDFAFEEEETADEEIRIEEDVDEIRDDMIRVEKAEDKSEIQTIHAIARTGILEDQDMEVESESETLIVRHLGKDGTSQQSVDSQVLQEDLKEETKFQGLNDESDASRSNQPGMNAEKIHDSDDEEGDWVALETALLVSSSDEDRSAESGSDIDSVDEEVGEEEEGEEEDGEEDGEEDSEGDDDDESVTDQAVTSQIYNEMTQTQNFDEDLPALSSNALSVGRSDSSPGEDVAVLPSDVLAREDDLGDENDESISDAPLQDDDDAIATTSDDDDDSALEESDDENEAEKSEEEEEDENEVAPLPSSRRSSTAPRGASSGRGRRSSNVHELRDGMRWTDEPVESASSNVRRESVVHELRDGFRWVDEA